MADSIVDLAHMVISQGRNPVVRVPPAPTVQWRQAVVNSVNRGQGLCSVTLGHSAKPIPNVPYPAHIRLTQGDVVQCTITGANAGGADIVVSQKNPEPLTTWP